MKTDLVLKATHGASSVTGARHREPNTGTKRKYNGEELFPDALLLLVHWMFLNVANLQSTIFDQHMMDSITSQILDQDAPTSTNQKMTTLLVQHQP
jgi:hypothetical protein